MYYENYLSYVLAHNDLIYVDTSTLMNADSMKIFLERNEDEFIVRNKKMIVTQWVQKELSKHVCSDNEIKRNQARFAFLLLEQFEDIFILEDENAMADIATFADSDLLSKLTLNKATATQVLITYDRALALDAYNLNDQGSNKGGKVMVCHINRAGYIKKCDCASVQNVTQDNHMPEFEPEIKEKIVYVDRPVMSESHDCRKWWEIPLAFVSGAAGCFVIDRYALPAIKKAISSVA